MATNGQSKEVSTRRSVLPELREMRHEFRDLLRDMWDTRWPMGMLRPTWLSAREPALDMFEREGKVIVKAEMPGIDLGDIDVTIAEGELRISGERKEEHEIKEENYYCSERSYGHVFRSVALPEGCDAEAVAATMKDGVLEIVIPRKEHAASKKVEVKAAH
jgi:HSP20 family protein